MTPLESTASLRYAIPELAIAGGALAVLAWDLVLSPAPGKPDRAAPARFAGNIAIALFALTIAALASAAQLTSFSLFGATPFAPLPALLFGGQLACDPFACVFRLFFALVTAFVLVAAIPTREAAVGLPGRAAAGGELIALVLTVCLGMNLMAMARTLLLVYVSIEIVSVVSFILAGYRLGDRKSGEAALKYVVFGGVSSGVMLYGMSWLYGLSRSIAFPDIADRALTSMREQGHVPNALAIAVACVMAGFAYKIAAVPFHMWAPDVYEGSPTLVAAFLSVGPKAAGFAVLVRFFRDALAAGTTQAVDLEAPWPVVAGVIAGATMTIGNLGALAQTNMKRLLAYSSVAHAGTMLLGFAVFDDEGITAVAFYLVAYCLMNLGAFLVVLAVSERPGVTRDGRPRVPDDTIDGLRGLGVRAPGMAAALTAFLFSLVGLPPFAGFVGKLYVFAALLRAPGEYRSWYLSLAALGALNTVVSLFYYARVVRAMYLEDPPAPVAGEEPAGPVSVSPLHAWLTALLLGPTVVLGLWWGPLYDFVSRSVTLLP